jgi:hypothetical protein
VADDGPLVFSHIGNNGFGAADVKTAYHFSSLVLAALSNA